MMTMIPAQIHSHEGIDSIGNNWMAQQATNDMSKTFENKAIEMIKEVDALRQEASEKLQKANGQLADVKELAMGYRQTIKNYFPMEQWEKFGISDKR